MIMYNLIRILMMETLLILLNLKQKKSKFEVQNIHIGKVITLS